MGPDSGARIWPEKLFSRIDPERMFARHGGLRWYVLYLLSNGEKRGIDIMEEMEKRSWGYWRPSPGSIYPLLKSLEQEGLIRKGETGYLLTDEGREVMGLNKTDESKKEKSSERVNKALSDIESYVEYLEETRDDLGEYQERLKDLTQRLMNLMNSKSMEKR